MNPLYVCLAVLALWISLELIYLKYQQYRIRTNKVSNPKGRPISFR